MKPTADATKPETVALPLRITLPGRPATKKNHGRVIQRGKKRFHVPSETFMDWQAECGGVLSHFLKEPIPVGVGMQMKVYLPNRQWVGDHCGYFQAACDCLQHYQVVKNDQMITCLTDVHGEWLYLDDPNPRMELLLVRVPHPLETARIK